MKIKTNLILSLSLAIIVTVVVMANNRKAETFKLPNLLNLDSSKAAQNLGKNKILIVSFWYI